MLSSLYVAASMPPYVETQIVDEDVEPVDFDADADLIGISFMTYNAPRAYEIADRFRAEKGRPVIFGGYHPTFMPEEAIQHADAVCVGEAEHNVPRMMEDFVAGELKPFYRSELAELAGLPIPKRDLIRKKDYAPVDVLQATRGCHYRCSFCSVAAFHQSRLRIRPVAEVIDELRALSPHVLFMDDNIIGDPEYAKQLFSKMIPLGKRWFSQCGIGIGYDEELLRLASRSGCQGLFIGFESLSQQGLRSWKKQSNVGKDYLAVVRKLHAAGIAVFAGFVFGNDDDTPDVFQRTLEFLLEANVESVQATRMTPFPGTPLFEEMDRQGRLFDKDWSHYDFNHVVFEPLNMHRETLDLGVAWVLRQFHTRGRVARRVWKSLRYLHPAVALRGVLPLNLVLWTGSRWTGTCSGALPLSLPRIRGWQTHGPQDPQLDEGEGPVSGLTFVLLNSDGELKARARVEDVVAYGRETWNAAKDHFATLDEGPGHDQELPQGYPEVSDFLRVSFGCAG